MQLWLHTPNPNSNDPTNLPITYKPHTSCFRLAQTRNSPKLLTHSQLSSQIGLNSSPLIFSDKITMPHNLTKVPKQTSLFFFLPQLFHVDISLKIPTKKRLTLKTHPAVMKRPKSPTSNFPILILSSF